MVAAAILIRVVDQDDAPGREGLAEPPVLPGCQHPSHIRRQYGLRLLGHPPDGTTVVIITDQGVVIDEGIRQTEPPDGGDFGLECPIGLGGLQWVTAEDEEHGRDPWEPCRYESKRI